MKKLDLKSALLGLGAGVVLMLCLGAATATNTSGPVGRFQMTGISNHAFVIDTVTGKVWQGYFSASSVTASDKDFRNPKLVAE